MCPRAWRSCARPSEPRSKPECRNPTRYGGATPQCRERGKSPRPNQESFTTSSSQTCGVMVEWMGNSRVKVAPCPEPPLCAVNDPPSSRAAMAPLCNPKPWPSFRVVKPWLKIRVRFSGGIPAPLSATTNRTAASAAQTLRRICLSGRDAWSQACLALLIKLMRI